MNMPRSKKTETIRTVAEKGSDGGAIDPPRLDLQRWPSSVSLASAEVSSGNAAGGEWQPPITGE